MEHLKVANIAQNRHDRTIRRGSALRRIAILREVPAEGEEET